MSSSSPQAHRGFLAGDGFMTAQIRDMDWSATPLGPIDRWSPAMRIHVAAILDSPHPSILYLGPSLIAVYNDAYLPLLGARAPQLGRPFEEVWPEARDTVAPLAERALAGESSYLRNAPFTLLRHGRPEQTWFDYAFGPVRDETGAVIGILNSGIETTPYMVLQRRQSFLLALGDVLKEQTAPRDVMRRAAEMLARGLDASRVHYAEARPDGTVLVHDDVRRGVESIAGVHRISDFGPTLSAAYAAGTTVVQPDVARDPGLGDHERAALAAAEIAAFLAIPLVRGGRLVAVLAVHQAEPRAWTEEEIRLTEEAARLTWDAVERARVEDALRASEERYRTLFHSIDEGFCVLEMIFDADDQPLDYRFIEVNPVFEEQTGLVDPIGKTARELVPDLDDFWFHIYGEVARTGVSVRFENHAPAMDRWFDVFASRVGGDGSRRVALVFTDITDRRRAHEALRRSEARLQLALDATRLGTWEWDASTDLIRWSPRALDILGVPAHPTTGDPMSLRHLVAPDDREVEARAQAAMRRGEPLSAEYRIMRPDGSVRWIAIFGRPEQAASGAPNRMVGTIADITARKRDEEALRENDRRKDEFLATLAHELRNPLAPIRNGLGILRMSGGDRAQTGRIHQIMDRQVTHMCRLVDDLLEVSRITRGKIELRQERVDLAAILHSAIETSTPHIERAQHHLEVVVREEPLMLRADPVRLTQVFANLLDNAAKYTDPGGRIRVVADRDGDEVVVAVRDNGVGIAPEQVPYVFDMFAQAGGEDRSRGGLGIGLTLVRRLVELHGGAVEARSEGLGKGTEVCVRLPMAEPSPATSHHAPEDAVALDATMRILVVDDNRDAADSLGALLELMGAHVQVAYDGQRALETLRAFAPHVMLLDLGMPGMDGFEVARRIRSDPQAPPVTLVALTGWGQDDDRRRSTEAGFDHHLVKPVDTATLEPLLRSLAPAPPRA